MKRTKKVFKKKGKNKRTNKKNKGKPIFFTMRARGPKVAQKSKTNNPWSKKMSATHGREYWHNKKTGETTWTNPEPDEMEHVETLVPIETTLPVGWSKKISTKYGREYWLNEKTGETTWEKPMGVLPLPTITTIVPTIAIIIPFRDVDSPTGARTRQLNEFIEYMTDYLKDYRQLYKIYIIEQENDDKPFNRGKLLNIGFKLAQQEGCQYFIFHDVDLIPSRELLTYYVEPRENPVHIADVWKDRYENKVGRRRTYFGGAVSFPKDKFIAINGFPNNFWGWGGEDDELLLRTNELRYTIENPREGTMTDLEEMNWTQKNAFLKSNELKFMRKRETLAEHDATWRTNGLNNLEYNVINDETLNDKTQRIVVSL